MSCYFLLENSVDFDAYRGPNRWLRFRRRRGGWLSEHWPARTRLICPLVRKRKPCERPLLGPACDLTAGKREVHLDLRFHFHWLAIQQVGLVFPLLYGFNRRRSQHGMPADQAQVLNVSTLAYLCLQKNRSLDSRLARQRRIGRVHFANQQTLRYALRDTDALRSCDLWHSHRRRADNAADYATHLSARHAPGDATHDAAGRHHRRRSLVLFNHLHFLWNLGGGAKLTVNDIGLYLLHHLTGAAAGGGGGGGGGGATRNVINCCLGKASVKISGISTRTHTMPT